MKLNSKYFLIIVYLLGACTDKSNDADSLNLKGKIQRIVETTYDGKEKFGNYEIEIDDKNQKVIYDFNSQNNIENIKSFNKDEELFYSKQKVYNKDGHCIETNLFVKDQPSQTTKFQIEDGKNISYKIYNSNGELLYNCKNYFSDNEIIKTVILKPSGDKDNTYLYNYDGGQLIEYIALDSLDSEIFKIIYERNSQGDVIKEINKFSDGQNDTTIFKYEYDHMNNWIKRYKFHRIGNIDEITLRNIYYLSDENIPDEKAIIGIWTTNESIYWYDFSKSGTYDFGYKSKIKTSGTWEINKENSILTLKSTNKNDSKKLVYELIGDELTLSTLQGKEKMQLIKNEN